jgi:hypothetical protein
MGPSSTDFWRKVVQAEEGVCQKAGELGRLFQLFPIALHSGIPPLECLPKFIVESARAHL